MVEQKYVAAAKEWKGKQQAKSRKTGLSRIGKHYRSEK